MRVFAGQLWLSTHPPANMGANAVARHAAVARISAAGGFIQTSIENDA
jgi:hypothetical protein